MINKMLEILHLKEKTVSVNEFIKFIKEHFPDSEYKATRNNGQVFKSKGWDDAIQSNKTQSK